MNFNSKQFEEDADRLQELVEDLDESIKEAGDESVGQTKEIKLASTVDNIPIQQKKFLMHLK